jgi:hypothetical protein
MGSVDLYDCQIIEAAQTVASSGVVDQGSWLVRLKGNRPLQTVRPCRVHGVGTDMAACFSTGVLESAAVSGSW